ncbi:hypothetical protein AC578_5466 [Pseudocercospora eumusae]|uniref:Uncharacterized protein n=1 Tax=Pseudocercospora eumusae TaxID=321146 RepID=A0A139HK48_9PEZI|nr:hypothetical protein AC578_5466 [Pseudocercospora eumusae]
MLLKTGVALLGACLITAARAETSTVLGVDDFDNTDTVDNTDHDGDYVVVIIKADVIVTRQRDTSVGIMDK